MSSEPASPTELTTPTQPEKRKRDDSDSGLRVRRVKKIYGVVVTETDYDPVRIRLLIAPVTPMQRYFIHALSNLELNEKKIPTFADISVKMPRKLHHQLFGTTLEIPIPVCTMDVFERLFFWPTKTTPTIEDMMEHLAKAGYRGSSNQRLCELLRPHLLLTNQWSNTYDESIEDEGGFLLSCYWGA